MNNNRRKQIRDLVSKLQDLKSDLESILQDEQEYRDNMPENMQDGERAQQSDECIGQLECANDELDSAIDNLNEIN